MGNRQCGGGCGDGEGSNFSEKGEPLRREIASDLMISLMVRTPRRLVYAYADANSKVPVLI
jgi:hypothetical protein